MFPRTLQVLSLMGFRCQNKGHGYKIPPATEANSNQVQESVLSTKFFGLLNKAVEFKGECDITYNNKSSHGWR